MLSLILPTYNESATILNLLEAIDGALHATPHEIIVVDDDSPDGTWKVATEFAKRRPRIKVLRRIGKKGLSSAVVDGFDSAHGDILAVMDADGQHDPMLLIELLEAIRSGALLSIGSRYVPGGSVGEWVTDRRIISSAGSFVARRLSNVRVSDPLGGFFAIRADLYRMLRSELQPTGFKILLELLAVLPSGTRVTEVPLQFRMRLKGQSKLTPAVHMAFALQVCRLLAKRFTSIFTALSPVLFLFTALVTALVLVPRAWDIRLLYTDSALRQTVQSALQNVADKQGWLLSDLEITSVTPDSVSLVHRDHLRSSLPVRHCQIALSTLQLTCAD